MARDSLFGETILWSGAPKTIHVPFYYKTIAIVSAVAAAVVTCFALVCGLALQVSVGPMMIAASWFVTIALGAWRLPLMWHAGVKYYITDRHVIWRRGPLRRTIDRNEISYALIRWHSKAQSGETHAESGDLVLVRAVPTGALRRTLTLTLTGVEAPDRLWAKIRGVVPSEPLGDGERPLAQRLDAGERVLWTAIPHRSSWTFRRMATAGVALALFIALVRMVTLAIPSVARVDASDALPIATFGVFLVGISLATLLLTGTAVGIAYASLLRPIAIARATRYIVTDRRVLIRRGNEELYLDRAHIAFVIESSSSSGRLSRHPLHDLFLILDGPQARAMAMSGAFDGTDDGDLRPVFSSIDDAETVRAILKAPASNEMWQDAA